MNNYSSLSKDLSRSILGSYYLFIFYFFKMRKEFLNNDGFIRRSPIREKTGLAQANDGRKQKFDFIYYDFSNQFVGGVVKPYRFEVFNLICICTLRDKANKGFIYIRTHSSLFIYFFPKIKDFVLNNIPIVLVKNWVNAIRIWCFERLERLDD